MRLGGISADQLDTYWPAIKPMLSDAMSRSGVDKDWGPDDVYEECAAKDMQVWVAHDETGIVAFAMTQILTYPRRKVLGIPFCGSRRGTIDAWMKFYDVLVEFAKQHKCSTVRGWGRKGWVRKMKADDVKVEFDIEVRHEDLH